MIKMIHKLSTALAKSLILAMIISLSVFSCQEQSKNKKATIDQPDASVKTVESSIAAIRSAYQRINSSSLKKERFEYEAENCVEEGVVTYFENRQEIVKITESGSIGDGSWTTEYYYQSGKLIFSYETLIGGPAVGEPIKVERRFYFEKDKLISSIEDKKVSNPADHGKAVMKSAYLLLKAYVTKDFAAAICDQS